MESPYCLPNYLSFNNDFRHWNCKFWIFSTFLVLCLTSLSQLFQLPESPRWLVKHGRHAEALAVISALDNTDIHDPEVQRTYIGIHETILAEGDVDSKGTNLKELFTHGRGQNFRRASLAIISQCFQQITGINLITYYAVSFNLSLFFKLQNFLLT